MNINLKQQNGQSLVALLMYMVIAIIVATASVALIINSSRGTDKLYQGATSHSIAESGAETAMIKLLRDRSYTGETINIGNGQAIVVVTGDDTKTIVSRGILNNFTRIITVEVDTSNDILNIVSWKEQ